MESVMAVINSALELDIVAFDESGSTSVEIAQSYEINASNLIRLADAEIQDNSLFASSNNSYVSRLTAYMLLFLFFFFS